MLSRNISRSLNAARRARGSSKLANEDKIMTMGSQIKASALSTSRKQTEVSSVKKSTASLRKRQLGKTAVQAASSKLDEQFVESNRVTRIQEYQSIKQQLPTVNINNSDLSGMIAPMHDLIQGDINSYDSTRDIAPVLSTVDIPSTKSFQSLEQEKILSSDEFYTTMHNVLIRSNTKVEMYDRIMSSITAQIAQTENFQKRNYHRYGSNNFGSSSTGPMMIHGRAFSTGAGPSTDTSSKKKEIQSSPTTNPTSTDNPISATTTSTPQALKKDQTMQEKAQAMVSSMISSIAAFIAKIPGVLWFYITHPKEFKEKMIELKDAAKKEAHHYYMGTKLLMADISTARQMLGRLLQGSTLTRRERKQFLRTVTDMFRVVPFSIFILIPFMEFALPFALKVFPNMLPSTFQDSLKAEENMKRELKSRIAMAEFFQETLQDLVKDQKKVAANKKEKMKAEGDEASTELESTESREETAASFLKFIEKAKKGEFLPPEVIIRYSAFFKDELTLDNMPRMQLINMCKYMSIPPYGNDHFLRFQLRHKIRVLQEDDQRILWEGIDSLTKMELREACQERGMRSTGLSKEAYTKSLQQWIDLSVNRNVPISLLIMSRTFFLREEMTSRASLDTDGSKSVAGLADAISGLDREVVNEVILESVTPDEKKSDPELTRLKLEVLEHQNELIQEENEQREAEKAKKSELDKQEQKEEKDTDKVVDLKEVEMSTTEKEKVTEDTVAEEIVDAKGKEDSEEVVEDIIEQVQEKKEEDENKLSSEEIDAISQLVSPDPVSAERQKLENIKAAMQDEDKEVEVDTTEAVEAEVSTDAAPAADIDMDGKEAPVETFAEEQDKKAAEQITKMEEISRKEAESSTTVTMEVEEEKEQEATTAERQEGVDYTDEKLDKAITRLKSKVESMVGNIEVQLSNVEEKIGDKLHFLDKDMDGILSREEMAATLQTVLKRPLTFDEAMSIAADMDENEDGYFSMDELKKWLETNKLVKLVEEGQDGEVDKIIARHAAKSKDEDQKDEKEKETSQT